MGPLRPGQGVHGKVQKKMFWKIKFWSKKKFFFWTVNQLKKTSDCIKIDPPGPGQNLEKKSKKLKKEVKILVVKKVEKRFQNFNNFS